MGRMCEEDKLEIKIGFRFIGILDKMMIERISISDFVKKGIMLSYYALTYENIVKNI